MKTTDIKNIASAYMQVLEGKTNEEKKPIDKVQPSELQGTHAQRKDKDINNDGKVDSSDEYLHNRRKAISKAMKKETSVDEAAPKMKHAVDPLKVAREKDRAHDAAMGRTATGRKKPERAMTSTQKSMASMRNEEVELDEASKEHLERLKAMLDKAKPGSADHSQIRHAISAQYGAKHIPAKHRNVKPDMYEETELDRENMHGAIKRAHGLTKEESELDESQRSLDAHKFKQAAKVKAGIPLRKPGESLAAYVTRKAKAQAKMQKESFDLSDFTVEELEDFMMSEDFDQLDEISKKTLGSYVKKASSDMANNAYALGARDPLRKPGSWNKAFKRKAGIEKATDRLAKEEVEQIDELSKKTLGSYINKSASDISHIQREIGSVGTKSPEYKGLSKMRKNRYDGIATAVKKLTKEEVENDEVHWPVLARIMERAAHGNMDNGSPRGEGLSPSAKDQLATATESDIDGNKAAADTAKAATANVKVGPKRRGDNTNGDKTMPTGK